MASSRKSPSADFHPLEQGLIDCLRAQHAPRARALLGLSGGVDSMALLEMLSRVRQMLDLDIAAMHVHHGVSAQADAWAQACAQACRARGIAFELRHIRVQRAGGESWEAQARALRYECLTGAGANLILLAHHLDDQCETFFLRLLRGSGALGLGAMRAARPWDANTTLVRPLLDVTRARILDYARARRLTWCEDASNGDRKHARNYLRHEVLPPIEARFPEYRSALARAIANIREAQALARVTTQADYAVAQAGTGLSVSALQAMGEVRARAVLRAFMDERALRAFSRARLNELLRQLVEAKADASLCLRAEGGALRRYRGVLYWQADAPEPAQPAFELTWRGEDRLPLPAQLGELRFTQRQGAGIAPAHWRQRDCRVRLRRGGERLRPLAGGPTRTVKNLLRESSIPPWERARLPLFCVEGAVLWVAGLGYDVDVGASAQELGLCIEWISASAA